MQEFLMVRIDKKEKYLWIFFYLWLLVDSVNGYFINSGISLQISQIFKLGILGWLVILLCRFQSNIILLCLILIYLSVYFTHCVLINVDFAESIINLTKLISIILLFQYFRICINRYQTFFIEPAKNIILVGFLVLISNLILGFLGFGYYTYESASLGRKGFFYAGNEVGGVVCTIFPTILFYFYSKRGIIQFLLCSVFLICLSISFATKSVILITLFSVLGIPLICGKKSTKIMILAFIVLFVFIVQHFVSSLDNHLVTRLQSILADGGVGQLIFSGRDDLLNGYLEVFFKGGLNSMLLGMGNNITVEMDLFDIMFNFGILGLILILLLLIYITNQLVCNKNNNIYCKIIIFQDVLLILMSIVAGHVIFSSMASLYIALTNSLMYLKLKKGF